MSAQGGKLTRVYEGWSDAQLLALLQLFRAHALEYVYGSDGLFAASVHAQLQEKAEADITETMRSLMSQFAFALDTKAFRNEVLSVDGQAIEVHVHLYETSANMLENKGGGVWHPDELARFLKKIKQYLNLLLRNPDIFFSRVQIWGKSVAETRSKFYALRELYEKEKKTVRKQPRSGIEETRFNVLGNLFHDVLPAPRVKDPTIFDKIPKLWSPDDLDMLIQFLVKITLDIQQQGQSDLVSAVSTQLHRTEQSVVNKLVDMRKNYLMKSSYPRAAHLPDIIFDSGSVAHKIFNADWSDPTDPFALGLLALKANLNAVVSQRSRGRKPPAVVPLTRKKRRTQEQSEATNNARAFKTLPTRATSSLTSRQQVGSDSAPEAHYTEFVREMAQKHKWSEKMTHDVCAGMDRFMDLYRGRKLKAFFEAIVQATPGVKLIEIFFNGQAILKTFESRHGGFETFGEVALGTKAEVKDLPSASQSSEVVTEYESQADATSRPVASAVLGSGGLGAGTEEPNVSPSDLTNSPLSVSEPENDDSSLEDENPIGVDEEDDDELDTLSIDSNDDESIMSAFKPRKTYPSGKSYGKSDEIMNKVKAACESCTKKKKQQSLRKQSCDSNDSDDEDEDSEDEQNGNTQASSRWDSLFHTVDVRINELKDRNRDLIERKEDRERRQQRVKWRQDIRIEVRSIQEVLTSS